MIRDETRLRALLGRPELKRMMEAMARRVRLGRGLEGMVRIADPSEGERRAVDGILGRKPSTGVPLAVPMVKLADRLREAGLCDSLNDAVELIAGVIVDEARARAMRAREWAQLRESLEQGLDGIPMYRTWVDQLFLSGVIKKMSEDNCAAAQKMMIQVIGVLRALPQNLTALATFATQVTGDSHALDAGMPVATLCLRAIADVQGAEFKHSAGTRRRLWESVGVVVDELSAPVLTLNLRADSRTVPGRILALAGEAGEPCYLTVRQLRQLDEKDFSGFMETIYVCENPSVVAAAAQQLGVDSKPLVCTAGQPASAVQMLLGLLTRSGCRLRYHGDLDPSGVAIANFIITRFGAEAWRMDSADYLARVRMDGPRHRGRSVAASWDATLAGHMALQGNALLEESVMDLLMGDLRR